MYRSTNELRFTTHAEPYVGPLRKNWEIFLIANTTEQPAANITEQIYKDPKARSLQIIRSALLIRTATPALLAGNRFIKRDKMTAQ
jgi:hypothetical protein